MSKSGYSLATFFAYVTLFVAILLPIIAAAIWLFWDQLAPLASSNLPYDFDILGLSLASRIAGFVLFLLVALVQVYGLLGLRHSFTEAAQKRALSAKSVHGFRRFAWVSLAMVFVGVVQHTGLIVILSLSDPAHPGILDVQFGTSELKALFMAVLLVFVAHVFAEGKSAKEENEAFL